LVNLTNFFSSVYLISSLDTFHYISNDLKLVPQYQQSRPLISPLNYLLQPDIVFRDAFYFTKQRLGKLDTQDEFSLANVSNGDSRQIEHTGPAICISAHSL